MKLNIILKKVKKYKSKRILLLILTIFLVFSFFRLYEFEKRAQFTWDQVDNAWHAKNIIINHEFPLAGMPAKQNSQISIGPYYYYIVALFYLLTNLDPIASPILASVTALISFFVIGFSLKKIFNIWVSLISLFIVSFSSYLIILDRIQWPVAFIPIIGLLIFLSLIKIAKGNLGYIFALMFLLGASLHIHFTSIFYAPIVLLFLPFFPRNKKTLKYIIFSFPILLVWLIPFFVSALNSQNHMDLVTFYKENSVGLHLRRVFQVSETALLEIRLIFGNNVPGIWNIFIIPLFCVVYYLENGRKSYSLVYLTILWFVIPLVGLSMFRGDLTPYYFSLTRLVSVGMISFLIYKSIMVRKIIVAPIFILFAIYFVVSNSINFYSYKIEGLEKWKKEAFLDFKESRGNEFVYGSAKTYLYYFYEYRAYGKK